MRAVLELTPCAGMIDYYDISTRDGVLIVSMMYIPSVDRLEDFINQENKNKSGSINIEDLGNVAQILKDYRS